MLLLITAAGKCMVTQELCNCNNVVPIKCGSSIFQKHKISLPLCAYHGVRNVSFSEHFAHVLNGKFHGQIVPSVL